MKQINRLCIILLLIGIVSSTSYVCSRTETTETWCNDDGSRTAVLGNMYIQNASGEYVPMTEAAKLEYINDQFKFSYSDWSFSIQPFVIYNGQFKSIQDIRNAFPNVNISKYISVGKSNYKFALNFSGVPQSLLDHTDYVGLRLVDSENLTWDDVTRNGNSISIKNQFVISYQDLLDSKFTLNLVNKTYLLIGNISANADNGIIFLDPLVTLNESNYGNFGDTYVSQPAPTTNYGTSTVMTIDDNLANFKWAYTLWNTSLFQYTLPASVTVDIVNVRLSLYMILAPTSTMNLQAYNTSWSNWTETTPTWSIKSVGNTVQDTVASGTTNGVWKNWNVTNAFKASYASSKNMSIMVNMTTANAYSANFTTKENGTTAYRPQLNVTYTITTSPTYPQAGLVGYWKFDENTGSYAADSSGNENLGTLVNSPTWAGSFNYQTPYALNFNGESNTVVLTTTINSIPLNFTATSNFTLCARASPTSWLSGSGTTYTIIGNANLTGGKQAITIGWMGNHTFFRIRDDSGIIVDTYGSLEVLNSWIHICGVKSGTGYYLYENGVQVNSSTATLSGSVVDWTEPWYIASMRGTGGWINGTIDEVKVWNRSLLAAEIMNESFHYCPLNLIGITAWNESNSAQTEIFSFTASNTTSSFSYTTTASSNSFSDYHCNSSFPTGSVTISISNSSFYSPRYYYPTLAYGGSYSLNAYLMPLDDPYPILVNFKVISSSGSVMQNALVTVQRQIGGTWVTVAQKYTDATGVAAFNLDYQTQYQIVTSTSGYSTVYWIITPTSSSYQIYPTQLDQSNILSIISQISSDCAIDNSSYPASININCSAADQSGQLSSVALNVSKSGTYGSIPICSVVDDTANFSLGCTVNSPGNQTISYTLTGLISVNSTPAYYILKQNSFVMGYQTPYSNGLFPAFLLSLTLGLLGLYINPSLGIIFYSSGWVFADLLHWIYMPPEAIGALAIITGLIVYILRT
ncbi:MAG: DNRLRE domain-containing protein [Candidatus Micrarchaeota archaeon]|nr:DNRLRE domain-containing protein [Candidatus Micrarchaeota archaeon]